MKRIALGILLTWSATGQVIPLSMRQAVEIAIEPDGNVRVQLAQEAVRQAESRRGQARASLLPQVDSQVAYDSRTVNLKAFGVSFEIPGIAIETPSKVGPFSVFDARANGSQTIFDFSSIRRYQAARAGVGVARSEGDSMRDQVIAQVAKAYLAALRSETQLETANANVALAGELMELAENQKAAGTGTGIDVTRAQVQLQNERQLLLVARNARRRAQLELLRAMDMPLDTEVELTDRLAYHPVEPPPVEQSIETALSARADWRAQQQREESARLSHSATKWERLPSLNAFGNYGVIGNAIGDSFPTRTYGVQLRVPVFDGGRRDSRRGESASLVRQETSRTADLRARIELELRLAADALESAGEQVGVAQEGLQLAENELAQARRRFEAGVASSIEVTDAQNRLARARDNQTNALFAYESARLDLGQAMGTIREMIQ